MAAPGTIARAAKAAAVALVLVSAGVTAASAQDEPQTVEGVVAQAVAAGASAGASGGEGATIAEGATIPEGATVPDLPPIPVPQCAPPREVVVMGMTIVIPCPSVIFEPAGATS